MSDNEMKHNDLSLLVVGAGAIVGITAALLRKNGYNMEIVCRDAEYASVISSDCRTESAKTSWLLFSEKIG